MAPATLDLIEKGEARKGDVIATARIAGIMAAKRTHELIPRHALAVSKVTVDFEPQATRAGYVTAEVKVSGQILGVEMEALTAVSVACLTIYDMLKAVDRGMSFSGIRLPGEGGRPFGPLSCRRRRTVRLRQWPFSLLCGALAHPGGRTADRTRARRPSSGGGRILAEDPPALVTQPPFSASAMDGYAVRTADVLALPARLKMTGEAAAGSGFGGRLDLVRPSVLTGAPLPEGADAVVVQENATREDGLRDRAAGHARTWPMFAHGGSTSRLARCCPGRTFLDARLSDWRPRWATARCRAAPGPRVPSHPRDRRRAVSPGTPFPDATRSSPATPTASPPW